MSYKFKSRGQGDRQAALFEQLMRKGRNAEQIAAAMGVSPERAKGWISEHRSRKRLQKRMKLYEGTR